MIETGISKVETLTDNLSGSKFQKLYKTKIKKISEKNGMSYIPWAVSWAHLCQEYPDAEYYVYENDNGRPWFDDGKTAWVKCSVTANGVRHTERLAVLNRRNAPIPAEEVTSDIALNAVQRCLTKACARHGVGLYVYEGEDIPSDVKEYEEFLSRCKTLIKDKSKLSDKAKAEVISILNEINPHMGSKIEIIESIDEMKKLYKRLLTVRK